MRKLITPFAISAALLFASQNIFAQNVGINTTQPEPSAALDIVGPDKGLLIPRVSLQSLTDNTTVPNPATALLVYNTNAGLGKAGFYYNSGTAANPAWSLINGGGSLTLPFSQLGTNNGPLFLINNNDANSNSIAISGLAVNAIGLRGATSLGKGVVGHSASAGTGVFASAANVNGKALEVSGPITIAGPGQSPGNGKVLTSDASGNATWQAALERVAFKAAGIPPNGSQSIPSGAKVKVAFANQEYDLNSNYNDINGSPHSTFIAPIDGIYQFNLKLAWNSNGVTESYRTYTRIVRTRAGNPIDVSFESLESTFDGSSKTSVDLQLIQGDMIHVEVENAGSENLGIFINNESSHFSGRLVLQQ
ncbi:C1q-like domain-containing protein [Dyadobacter sp. CY347]|uniref:C1q-like domain-containing protein n=1 Tax=Dyadobacter sp. CY347 TaxID=2909336 RepID=UPI001F3B0951|nr:hypothetical protein [Dyadobacter sp. CY347]MCF2491188.1 hypothetical protein [Dyadobacter sp. CY347]